MAVENDLLATIERHLVTTGTRPTRFGKIVMRDPRFVFDLRAGRTPRPAIRARVAAYLSAIAQSDRQ